MIYIFRIFLFRFKYLYIEVHCPLDFLDKKLSNLRRRRIHTQLNYGPNEWWEPYFFACITVSFSRDSNIFCRSVPVLILKNDLQNVADKLTTKCLLKLLPQTNNFNFVLLTTTTFAKHMSLLALLLLNNLADTCYYIIFCTNNSSKSLS